MGTLLDMSLARTYSCTTYVRGKGYFLKRSLFKMGFYPPKCGNVVKMSDTRVFSIFFWSGASCGPIVVSSIPRPQLLTELRAPTGGSKRPALNVLFRSRVF
jgi:hypothetical protein